MLHTFSPEYQNFPKDFLSSIKELSKDYDIDDIYFTNRCYSMVTSFVSPTSIIGCGYKKIYVKSSISPYLKVQKIVVVMNIEKDEIEEVAEFQYLFPSMYIQTLQLTQRQHGKQLLKSWKEFKEKVKKLVEVNFNFQVYLDGAYYITEKQKKSQYFKNQNKLQKEKVNAFRSFLLGFPKLYEFELYRFKSKTNTSAKSYQSIISQLKNQLKSCLKMMETHTDECKNFDKISSPKLKILVLNRQVIEDFMSPLIYSYFYGPLCQQLNYSSDYDNNSNKSLLQSNEYLSSKGKVLNSVFEKDLDQTSNFLKKITDDKTILDGPFEANYFYKAKKVISQIKDPSPLQLSVHIALWKQSMQFAQKRQNTSAVQQSIANRICQSGKVLSNGSTVDLVEEWVLTAKQQEVTQFQYLKLSILTELSGKLWFWQRSSLKTRIEGEYKQKYTQFISKAKQLNISKTNIREKPQKSPQERSVLYRHEPPVLKICQSWIKEVLCSDKKESQSEEHKFQKICINNDLPKNRQSKLILLFDGIMGYNQLAMLRRMFSEVAKNKSISVIAQSYMNTKQYCQLWTSKTN